MKFKLVSTRNTLQIMDAADAVTARLHDSEIMGLGLVYGRPGLGKTATLEAFASRSSGAGLKVAFVRAMRHWTETSMLKALIVKYGQAPDGYRKDLLFDQLERVLKERPAVFIIDEIDAIAGKTTMIGMLKDLHDTTPCAFLMVGEERVDAILRRYASFYNRGQQVRSAAGRGSQPRRCGARDLGTLRRKRGCRCMRRDPRQNRREIHEVRDRRDPRHRNLCPRKRPEGHHHGRLPTHRAGAQTRDLDVEGGSCRGAHPGRTTGGDQWLRRNSAWIERFGPPCSLNVP